MPAKRDVKLDRDGPGVDLRVRYVYASTGASTCFLYGADGKQWQRIEAVSAGDGTDTFPLGETAQALSGRVVFIEAHVFAQSRVPAPVGASATVVQGENATAELSDSRTILDQKQYAVFKFAFQFA